MKVLYLEDEANIREVTHEYLKMKGYDVILAEDGNEAVTWIEKERFDLAILDILVPYVSGLEVLEVLRKHAPDTAVLMLSALGDEKHQLEAFNRHADDYIIKPFSPILLLKRIEAILRRVKRPVFDLGLIVDTQQYQVFHNQESLNLTLTEYLIFEALYSNPQRVYTREMLLNVIAPDDFMVSDRVVDAHIKNLRKKLPIPCIKTIVGLGYQYKEQDHEALE